MSQSAVPAPGIYNVDPSHSTVAFSARHLMVSKVRGRFTDFSGVITIAEQPLDSSVEAVAQTASITTNDEQRDGSPEVRRLPRRRDLPDLPVPQHLACARTAATTCCSPTSPSRV